MTDTPDKNRDANVPDEGAAANVPDDRASFDDDRLLAYALGLEDDAELAAAVVEDEGLRRRLDALRAGLDDVGAGLERLVPAPEETYADPAAARWDGLRPFFAPPPERRPARGSLLGRWRVLVPLLGATLAVAVVGAFALRDGPIGTQRATDEAGTAAESADAPTVGSDASKSAYGAKELAADLELYETAFVGRAGEVADGRQRFTVVRRFKGLVTDDIYLEVVDRPLDPGALAMVLLSPVSDGQVLSGGAGEAVPYEYQGIEALARPLPPDADPEELAP
jgi:hypothetical protein